MSIQNPLFALSRPLSAAAYHYSTDEAKGTGYIDIADQRNTSSSKTGLAVAMEELAGKLKSLHGEKYSNLSLKDVEDSIDSHLTFGDRLKIFFGGTIAREPQDMYETNAAKALLEEGNLRQIDLFDQDVNKYGGIKYGNTGDLASGALSLAQADIGLIEKAARIRDDMSDKPDWFTRKFGNTEAWNGQLSLQEAESANYGEHISFFDDLDIDGDKDHLSDKEYASYFMAIDGLVKSGEYSYEFSGSRDGLITEDEAKAAAYIPVATLRAEAQRIYRENFANG